MAEAAPAASATTAAGGGRPLPTSDGGAPVSANAHAAGGPGLRGAAEEDDVLLINVGGERFTTTRYVLPASV
jgi:hypothetical protein